MSKKTFPKDMKVCHPMPDLGGDSSGSSSSDEEDYDDAVMENGKAWEPGQTLRVWFMDPPKRSVADKCFGIMKEWEQYANINFAPAASQEDSDLRVAFVKGGSYSYLGTDNKNIAKSEHTMNFGWLTEKSEETEYRRVVLHETGHALGLSHEHQHPESRIPWDKDAVIAYYSQQGWTAAQTERQVLRGLDSNRTQYSKYDKHSIMEYPIPKELVTDPRFAVGWNTELSQTDKDFIGQVYPGRRRKPSTKTTKTTGTTGTTGKKTATATRGRGRAGSKKGKGSSSAGSRGSRRSSRRGGGGRRRRPAYSEYSPYSGGSGGYYSEY
jgi:hypothetical protein